MMSKKLYLFNGIDGYYYIVSEISILVDVLQKIVVNHEYEFLYTVNAVKPKVRKGTIVMESGNYMICVILFLKCNYYFLIIIIVKL